ncbi:MAG: hypothetical protein IKY33_04065 [Clostridia bacterium]|nr:hypothetical protein [Clostridia bacterium]
MYYCFNCNCVFTRPRRYFHPYPDYGGEYYYACPCCKAPEMFHKAGECDDRWE